MLKQWRSRAAAHSYDTYSLIYRLATQNGARYWKRYVVVALLMAAAALCTATCAYLIGTISNAVYVERSFYRVAAVSVAFIVIFTIKGLSNYGQLVILARIGNRISADNQRRMFDKLLQQDLAYFQDRHSSEFTARMTYGANAASSALNLLFLALGRDALTLVGLVAVMLVQAPILGLVALIIMPPTIFMVRNLIKRVRHITRTQFSGGANILQTMQETLQGLRIIKALNLESEFRRRVYRDVNEVEHAANKLARVSNRSAPMMEALGGIAVALTLLYGGYRVLVLGAEPGEFISFITAFLLAYEPAKRIARLNVDLTNVLVGVQVVFEILDLPDRGKDDDKPALNVGAGRIEFHEVSSSYRRGQPVLRRMSFVAEPGTVNALIGPSGGGKTTILNLLLRLYERNGGAILIDGQDILAVNRASLREKIAYVGQDVFLFRGSIRENIAFGRIGASEAEIISAAKAACAHDFIVSIPTGYDAPVGEQGLQLSGGQRQRIAVARALLRDAQIILLDEPTASLDSESERHVQQAMSVLFRGRTTLVIAHRLHTIKKADVIHVVEHGEIVESGRHEKLLQDGKRYADFYKLQIIDGQSSDDARDAGALAAAGTAD
jgi:ABC-type multidrug transport system fused ATPase/permease subunit